MSSKRFEFSDMLLNLKSMSQQGFIQAGEMLIFRATTATEKLLCSLETYGGHCPTCKQDFNKKHCNKGGSDYIYYSPGCSCFEDRLIKLSKMDRDLIRGNIPLKYRGAEFANINYELIKTETASCFNDINRYCNNNKEKGAYIYGSIGSGKTLSAVLIAKHFIREGRRVGFFNMPQFIKTTIDKKGNDDFILRSKSFDVVILDDLTKDVPRTDWGQGRIHEFINELDQNKKIVIITDEKPPGEAVKLFLPSIGSRIAGSTRANVIRFIGDDFRKKEAEL